MTGEPLTNAQQIWLHILSVVFSCLSFAASITVMQIVRNSKRKKGRLSTYDRLLFGISACDLVNSLATATDSFFEPRDNEYSMVWAFGNDATCNLAGFFSVFFITTWLYHAAISLYYVLLVRFGFRDESIGWKSAVSFHLVAILWPALSGTAVLVLNAFGPTMTSYGCFVSDWPNDCVKSTLENPLEEGEVECNGQLAGLIAAAPTYAAFSTILLSNLMIYYHVRTTITKTTRNSVLRFDKKISDPSSPSLRFQMSPSRLQRSESSGIISTGQLERIRAVRNQSLLYFLVTAATLIPVGVQKYLSANTPSLSRESESSIYLVIVLRAIFTPSSGFFNLIIFCRPTYLRYRRNFPEASRIEAFRRTIEAGTGHTGGTTRRREYGNEKSRQSVWGGRLFLKRFVRRQEKAAAPATTPVPVVVAPPVVARRDREQFSEERKRQDKKSNDVTTDPNVDVENENDLTGTPHELDQGEYMQPLSDGGWHSGKPKTISRDTDYSSLRKDAFPSSTSINFVMDDRSLDQSFSSDLDEELGSTSVDGLPVPALLSGASHEEGGSRQLPASNKDKGQHSSTTNHRPAIEFSSSCIEAISTTSTVEA